MDECHIIKNKLGRISLACGELDSVNTWALSGTPFQNKLEDIFPILRFMGHPCGYMAEFKELTKGKDERMNANRVQAVLRTCMMRRTKKETLMGKPLIVLPKKRIRMVTLKLNEEEFALYRAVEQHAIDKINKYVQKGTEMKHFSHVLTMLLRCRQVCDHPFLVLQHINKDFSADDLDNALAKVKETDTNSVDQKVALSASRVSKLRKVLQAARKQKPTGDVHHCPICTGEVEDPIITKKCRHTFCRECITNSMTENPCCPFVTANGVCGQELDERDLKMDSDTGVAEDAETGDWMENADLEWMPSTKTEAFRKQLGEWRINHPNDKIVLFSQFTKMLDIIQRVLDDDLWSYTRYQGGMTMEERAEALNTFKSDPGCQIMLISIKAGGVGLNLTHANLVICIDLWWNAAVELQAFDRVHRLGQKKEVFITRFCTQDTVESRMLSLQKKKLAMSKAAMGEGDAALGKLTRQDLLGLFVSLSLLLSLQGLGLTVSRRGRSRSRMGAGCCSLMEWGSHLGTQNRIRGVQGRWAALGFGFAACG